MYASKANSPVAAAKGMLPEIAHTGRSVQGLVVSPSSYNANRPQVDAQPSSLG